MYSGVSLAGAFGGLLAYAIEKMNGCAPSYKCGLLGRGLSFCQDWGLEGVVLDRKLLAPSIIVL